MSRVLIVFAKEPIHGRVKTRLNGCFLDVDLVRLYKAFVKDTLTIARKVRGTKKILAFSSVGYPRFLKTISVGFELIEQEGRNLGERMFNAFVYAREIGAEKTVIIGTDSPTLPRGTIEKAFKTLDRKDMVLGPSFDGGYYLIGMKNPCRKIFNGIRWSSSAVLRKTINNAKATCKETALIDEWYDIDDRKGLDRLRRCLSVTTCRKFAKNTKKFLKEMRDEI